MNRYSPLWSQIVDSSLWCEPDYVVKVFLTMIAKKDLDDVVRGTAFNIAQWAKKTEKETLEALKILSSPDTKRIEPQQFEGRRIERVQGGWLVLNGAHYREMMSLATRREYKRVKQAEYRQKGSRGGGETMRQRIKRQVRGDATSQADDAEMRRIKRNGKGTAAAAGVSQEYDVAASAGGGAKADAAAAGAAGGDAGQYEPD